MFRSVSLAAALAVTLTLSACDSAEERAEQHYQSALTLLEEGDVERALVELRNVFDNNGFHKEARQLYADLIYDRGQLQEAYGQYLRLIEQYPDTLQARLRLAQMAMVAGNWDEVERQGRAAVELAPDDPEVATVAAVLDYRAAALAGDRQARAEAVARARTILESRPEDEMARKIVIDSMITGDDPAAALPELDKALALDPQALDMHTLKLSLLLSGGDEAAAEAQLVTMVETFPDNLELRQSLIAWYIERGRNDAAEALLRSMAGPPGEDPDDNMILINFLAQTAGPDAARQELERLIQADDTPGADLWRAMSASFDFDSGDQAGAIAKLQDIVASAEATDQTRDIRVILARMLIATGNPVGARSEVETVIEQDATHVEALKLRASWAVDDDRPDAAINDLRAALSQAPRDPDIMTLMAAAHERAGSPELAGERLALAVEVSNAAPEESMRYAAYLMGQGRDQPARAVLEDALRRAPGNLPLLSMAGDLALRNSDWGEVDRVLASLGRIDSEEARTLATDLRTARLMNQDRMDETASFLEEQIAQGGDAGTRATAMMALTRFRNGDLPGARESIDTAMAEQPDNPQLIMLSANLHFAAGDGAAAEAELRRVLELAPQSDVAAARLYSYLEAQGRPDEAEAVLTEGLEAVTESVALQSLRARDLEYSGDIDGAIAIYETLYAADSSNVMVANNLASLISSNIDTPEALDRAAAIARRLRGRDVPAFQDTYGWIEFRRGNIEEALTSLQAAAAGLPDDPLVQYHLGKAAAAADRPELARPALEAAIRLSETRELPQLEDARATLDSLPAAE